MKTTDIKTVIAASAARIAARPYAMPIFGLIGDGIALHFGAAIDAPDGRSCRAATVDVPVTLPALVAGTDYAICLGTDGGLVATDWDHLAGDVVGGFHFAPGGNADGTNGGSRTPAINPDSLWDLGFRPTCADPRGMAFVADEGLDFTIAPFWADIYLLNRRHLELGTSICGEVPADGANACPLGADGKAVDALDYDTAAAIMDGHGKGLLSIVEFFAAARGVTEKSSALGKPKICGLDAPRTSRHGLMQATGNLTVWGHDGNPDARRAALLGGRWSGGVWSGSRDAWVASWPDYSSGWFGARGRADHLALV